MSGPPCGVTRGWWPASARWSLGAALVLACGGTKDLSTATGGESDGGSTGAPMSTSDSVTATGVTAATPETSVDPSGSGSSTSAGEVTGSATGGDGSSSLPEACQALCVQAVDECDIGFPNGFGGCADGCVNNFAADMGACLNAAIVYLDCIAGLDCRGLTDALVKSEPGACSGPAADYVATCG